MAFDENAYRNGLEKLRHPAMTTVEEGLRSCLEMRPDIKGGVLTGKEMADYILWMAESFGNNTPADLEDVDFPPMLYGGGISELGRHVMSHAEDAQAKGVLASLYQSSQEAMFFLEDQDISAGFCLRYYPPYWREDDYFEVHYVFSGECPHFFENETVALAPGSVIIIPPGMKNAYDCPSDECSMLFFKIRKSTFSQVFWSHLSRQDLMANFFSQALSGSGSTTYLRFETDQDTRIELTLYAIYQEYGRNRKYSSQLTNSLMSTFFLLTLQEFEGSAQISRQSSLLWKPEFVNILRYIQDHFQTVSLEELSALFGYSRRQLIRIIQSSTGSSLSKLQTRMRMEMAARMLRTRAAVDDIALEVGFTDRSSFYRAFRNYYGCTPKQFAEMRDEGTEGFVTP